MLRVLLTNDDGIEAEGLQAMRRALVALPGIELAVIAPDGNRSAFARMITTRRPLWVQEVPFEDGTSGFATDGTPVDCVRLAKLGLVERVRRRHRGLGHQPRLQPGRRHHLLGHGGRRARGARARDPGHRRLPAVQRARDGLPPRQPLRLRARRRLRRARGRPSSTTCRCPTGTLLNINVPAGEPDGVQVTRLGKRIYRDELKLDAEDEDGGRRYWIYGADPGSTTTRGTDLAAVHARHIAVTPVHFDLTDLSGLDALTKYDLARLLAPAAREVQ